MRSPSWWMLVDSNISQRRIHYNRLDLSYRHIIIILTLAMYIEFSMYQFYYQRVISICSSSYKKANTKWCCIGFYFYSQNVIKTILFVSVYLKLELLFFRNFSFLNFCRIFVFSLSILLCWIRWSCFFWTFISWFGVFLLEIYNFGFKGLIN